MRVGIFTYGIERPERLSGIARYTIELTRALKKLNSEIELILLNPYPHSEIEWYSEFQNHYVPGLQRLPAVLTAGHALLDWHARKLNLDILHDPGGNAPFLAPSPPYRRVVTIHDAFARVVPQTQDPLMRLLFRTLVPLTRFTADSVLTVSEASAADLHRACHIPRDRIAVTPLGVHALGQGQDSGSLDVLGIQAPYFLYVGNLTPRKNLPRVLEAFTRLQARHPGTQLVIVGPQFWGGLDIFKQASGTRNVILTGHVNDSVLHTLYTQAAALVFPSLYEGFGLPALEAMTLGCPVITSNLSSLPEVVGDAAYLVDPLDVKAITDAMSALLTIEPLRADLRQRGLVRARQFSWENTARQTLEVYRAILDRKGSGDT